MPYVDISLNRSAIKFMKIVGIHALMSQRFMDGIYCGAPTALIFDFFCATNILRFWLTQAYA